MKKSIVLLVSLLFITAISALILKNLDDTNAYMKEQNHKLNKAQLMMIINNAQIEASKVIKKYSDDIPSLEDVPFSIKEVDILLSLSLYDKYDINVYDDKTKKIDNKKYEKLQKFFWDNSVDGFENFVYLLKGNQNIKNSKQLDDIITTVIKQTYSNKILEIKDELGFISTDSNSKLYELNLKVKYLKNMAKAYYILDKDGEVKYFELSFK